MNYLSKLLAQQAGGLSDDMFQQNPFQSNRARNWFNLDWLLYNELNIIEIKLKYKFIGLDAERNSIALDLIE